MTLRRHLAFPFLLAATLCTLLPTSPSRAAQIGEIAGVPVKGEPGVAVTVAEIMRMAAVDDARGVTEPVLMPEFEGPERDDLPQNPASPRVASVPEMSPDLLVGHGRGSAQGIEPFAPQTIGVNFTAATLSGGTFNTGAFPPDCDGAVGPTQYIVGVNGRIVSFNKTTGASDGVLNASTNTFFSTVRNASGTSDPQVRYDRLSNRWFISVINVSTPNRWLLAVSDAASNGVISATTVWTYYFFVPATVTPAISNGSTCLADYPSLGIDANALYMGANEFCGTGQPFQQTDVFVIRKSSVLSGGPIVVTTFRAVMSAAGGYVGPWSPRGVDNYDPAATEGYFMATDGAVFGQLDFLRVANPGGTPTLSANIPIVVPATSQALNVPHLGNTGGANGNLDPLDDRPFMAHIRNQQLWTSQNIKVDNTGVVNATDANNTRNGARWYQFNVPVGSGTPTIVQSGIVFTQTANNLTTERHYWVPSIMVSGQGHAAMGFSTAGTNERVNAATVGRLANDPPGTMQTPVLLTASSTAYNPPSDTGAARGSRRWGDYSITSLDPLDDMSMWTVQEFCSSANIYGVRVARLIAPPPATPSALADITAGQAVVNVTLTGLSVSGSGFYDPGADLPSPARPFNHLSATITNGAATGTPPTLVSATYVNPTTVNLVLNASAATANIGAEKYTVTITNPDGQSVGAAVVHVVSNSFAITAAAGAGGTISPNGVTNVPGGGSQAYTITPDDCHTIADVLVDGASVGAVGTYTFTNVTANHTISASFNVINYTIGASAGLGGGISPAGITNVACGGGASFTITPGDCFTVADVLVDGVSVGPVNNYVFSNVTANHTIAASFAEAGPYTITATAGAGGIITPGGPTSVGCGADQAFSIAASDACHAILDVLVDGVSVGAVTTYTFTNVQANHTIDASFATGGPYTITASAGAGGTIAPSGAVGAACGDTVAFAIAADAGFAIQDVLVDAASVGAVSAYTFSNVQANHDIAASFVDALCPSVTVGVPNGGETVISGGMANLTWTATDNVGVTCVDLLISIAGAGGPFTPVATCIGNSGTFAWTVEDSASTNCYLKVVAHDAAGNACADLSDAAFTIASLSAVDFIHGELTHPVVLQNRPNPFNPTTRIGFGLPQAGHVTLSIFSASGQLIRRLAHGEYPQGYTEVTWDGKNDEGRTAQSGVYFYRFESGSVVQTRRLVMSK